MSIPRLALPGILAAGVAVLAAGGTATNEAGQAHAGHAAAAPAKLVEIVSQRHAYQPLFGCASGPDHGAMGVHNINGALAGDGEIDATRPEALIYEPWEGGLRLVGVEFIVDAATWLANHNAPPMLEGQAFQLVSSPNRYGFPPFFELHALAL